MATLSNNINLSIDASYSKDIGLSSFTAKIAESLTSEISDADIIYATKEAISSGSNDIDLSGSLETPLGDSAVFVKVMGLYIRNAGDNSMTVGGPNNIPLFADTSDKLNLASGASVFYLDETGISVTGGTGDLITIAGTNTDEYEIIVFGSSS